MVEKEELIALLKSQPMPPCAALIPFEVFDVDLGANSIKLLFDPQPAFENHFGNIQGGFAVAIIDVIISVTAFAKTGLWLPTVELKSSFLTPTKIGRTTGEGRILRAGRNLVFVEGKLFNTDGELAVHSTATLIATPSGDQ